MIRSLLVANRGEIARRIFRSAEQMGIRCIAVFVEADADAPFVDEADVAVRLPGTYLDGDAVIGCLYIYPASDPGRDAAVQSWVTAERAEMDAVVRRSVSGWLASDWPFEHPEYATVE